MRVLHIIIDLDVGGAELMLERLLHADSSSARQHRIISIKSCGSVGRRMQSAGFEIETLGADTMWQVPAAVISLRKKIRDYQPDVIQTWMYHSDLIGGLTALLAGYRCIVWGVRTNASPRSAFGLKARLLQRVCAILAHHVPKKIIVVSRAARSSHAAIGYPDERMEVIGNGVVIPSDEDLVSGRSSLRATWGFGENDQVVGMMARFDKQKGHKLFLKAVSAIASEFPNAKFVMIGRNCDTTNLELQRWIDECGMRQKILLLGERRDPFDCLAAMDIFCLPSIVEGFPNVLAEAMASGVACVASDVGAVSELLAGRGAIVPPGSELALQEAISEYLSIPSSELKEIGRVGRRHMQDNFAMTAVVGDYVRVYHSVLQPQGAVQQGAQ